MQYPWDIEVTDETHTGVSFRKITVEADIIFRNVKKEDHAFIEKFMKKTVDETVDIEIVSNKYDEVTQTTTARVDLSTTFSDDMPEWIDTLVREFAYSVHAASANIKTVNIEQVAKEDKPEKVITS